MNQTLKDAIREVEALPEADQEELARVLLDMAVRKRVDAELAASEAEGGEVDLETVFRDLRARQEIDRRLMAAEERGGSTPHAEFMAELRAKRGR